MQILARRATIAQKAQTIPCLAQRARIPPHPGYMKSDSALTVLEDTSVMPQVSTVLYRDFPHRKPETDQYYCQQSHNLEPFPQAKNDTSNVSRGLTCQNFKQNGYLHASP